MKVTHKSRIVSLLIFCSLLQKGLQVFTPSAEDKACFDHDSACSSCIREPECHWCSVMKEKNEHRCFSINRNLSDVCESDAPESPKNSFQIKRNLPFADKSETENIIQLRPQQIKLSLRKGVAQNITLEYRQVADYPLDLYYLMDLSYSMRHDKDTLEKLGEKLARRMTALTKKFRIGFGSFVDKVKLPFANTHPASSYKSRNDVVEPFSFKNNLKLTQDARRFTAEVRDAQISTNIDSPEGGFDALMQVMVCDKEIGWRDQVRKIVVFSTDAEFHMAGDGKLAGIVIPNDGKCHLDASGLYDKYGEFDYPSIGQINKKANEKDINLIFAVKRHDELYKSLASEIDRASFGKLDGNSTNVIQILTDVYNSISSRVEIMDRSVTKDPISLRYFTQCNNLALPMRETGICQGVREGQSIDFHVSFQLDECPPGVKTLNLTLGIGQDQVGIELHLLCECDCEQKNAQEREENSELCNYLGTRQCGGVCGCNSGFYGPQCECSKSGSGATANATQRASDPSKCRPAGDDEKKGVCSGRGRCSCETCICDHSKRFSGTFCECDKSKCMSNEEGVLLCSGHGTCDCDRCICEPSWQNKFCQCQNDAACVKRGDPSDQKCSGNGKCDCGVCSCQVKDGIPYSGKFCEECPSCGKGKCEEFRDCVQCDVWNSGKLGGQACRDCTYNILQLDSLEDPREQKAKVCTFNDDSTGCSFTFAYLYKEQKYFIFAQRTQTCLESVAGLVAISVIGGIVAIGVLTLIAWKFLTTIHDRREFAKFEKERYNAKWEADENPLYENPSTTISNPAFQQ